MRAPGVPVTQAVRALRAAKVEFTPHHYPYVERGGTRASSEALGVDEHAVVKTIVLEAKGDRPRPLIVLMHGDREISTQKLARLLAVKDVVPASEAAVERYTGYLPGGTSPFGTRTALPVYVEETILALERIYINGGKRGFLVSVAPDALTSVLKAIPVQVGVGLG
jgi:Cys-tRNA(Pro) deacylase